MKPCFRWGFGPLPELWVWVRFKVVRRMGSESHLFVLQNCRNYKVLSNFARWVPLKMTDFPHKIYFIRSPPCGFYWLDYELPKGVWLLTFPWVLVIQIDTKFPLDLLSLLIAFLAKQAATLIPPSRWQKIHLGLWGNAIAGGSGVVRTLTRSQTAPRCSSAGTYWDICCKSPGRWQLTVLQRPGKRLVHFLTA